MQNLFECKVKYSKVDEQSGKEKKVTETYLIDAVSFTEAETRLYKEMEMMVRGEFTVTGIRKANYSDVLPFDDAERWYKSKISYLSVDEEAGKEKKVSNQILIMANDIKDAFERINESMKGMTVDFEINAISESPVFDFFPYFNDENEIPANLKPVEVTEEE